MTETTIFTSASREAEVEVEFGVAVAVCFSGAFSDDILVAVMDLDLVSICRKSVEFQGFFNFLYRSKYVFSFRFPKKFNSTETEIVEAEKRQFQSQKSTAFVITLSPNFDGKCQ